MIKDIKVDEQEYAKEKSKHIKMLNERISHGQRHPDIERN
jgi:hypothetical protein